MDARVSTKDAIGERNSERHQTNEGRQCFGMKADTVVNAETGLGTAFRLRRRTRMARCVSPNVQGISRCISRGQSRAESAADS